MNIKPLIEWISSAVVDVYKKGDKCVYVSSKGNSRLILICDGCNYTEQNLPNFTLVWLDGEYVGGYSEILYQDIVNSIGEVTHAIGDLEGDFTARESLEDVWTALYQRLDLQLDIEEDIEACNSNWCG